MSNFKSYRNESRIDYGSHGDIDREQLKLGCLMRIADATEMMAKRYTELMDENEKLRRWLRESDAEVSALKTSNAALRGVITRMKKERNR